MKNFVIGDPHAFFGKMRETLAEHGFFEDESSRLILLGDILDRGEEAVEMVDFLLKLAEEGRLVYVRGNHEDLLVSCLQSFSKDALFGIIEPDYIQVQNGTWGTLLQLSGMNKLDAMRYPRELVSRVMHSDFYRKLLPLTVDDYETKNHIFVHGFIPATVSGRAPNEWYTYNPNWREADNQEWRSARWFNGMKVCSICGVREPGKTIVCGHYHTSYGHSYIKKLCPEWGRDAIFDIYRDNGIIAIDASTYNTGLMNCLVIDEEDI